MELKVFKIKDSETGLFSTGGYSPNWTKRGKTWSQINHVKTHLRQHCNTKIVKLGKDPRGYDDVKDYKTVSNNIPETWVIVEMVASGTKCEIKEYSAKGLYPNEFPS